VQITERLKQPYKKERVGIVLGLAFVLCVGCYLLLLFWTNQRVVPVDVSGCDTAGAERFTWEIEKMKGKSGYMTIKGYAYEPGYSEDEAHTTLLAYDEEQDVYYRLPTENVKKEKLTEKADDGFNYDYAEFTSVFYLNKVPSGSKVFIWYQGNGKNILIPTEKEITY
jgi:hypothetical protein